MPLSDIAVINITTQSIGITQRGFGTPLILGSHTRFSERVRYYFAAADMIADGFAVTDPEYLAALKIFSQTPTVERVAVGRRVFLSTFDYRLTPAVVNSTTYRVKVNGITASYTSDASATAAEIATGLAAAITANGLPAGFTATNTGDEVRIYHATPGNFVSVENLSPALLRPRTPATDPGVATDLAAIQLENNDWYTVISTNAIEAETRAIALWVEGAKKLFIARTLDTYNLTGNTVGVLGYDLKAAGYARTALIYHHNNAEFIDAAWAGRCLPFEPGSETWAFKTLNGVTAAANLTATHINNLKANGLNYYEMVGGIGLTRGGIVAAGEYIDVVRSRDWLEARLQERIASRLAANKKVAYTDAGVAVIEGEVRSQLQEAVDVGMLSANPAPAISVPKVANVSPADKAARHLRNVNFTAVLAGAIHKVTVNGSISL